MDLIDRIIIFFESFFMEQEPIIENKAPEVVPVPPTTTPIVNSSPVSPQTQSGPSKIDLWCQYAQKREGWFPGSPSYVNNNPGNLKFHGQALALNTGPKDGSEFCKFRTYQDGYSALKNMFIMDCSGKSSVHPATETILQYYQGIMEHGVYVNGYAPASDNNDPISYSQGAADEMGVPVSTQIKDLL